MRLGDLGGEKFLRIRPQGMDYKVIARFYQGYWCFYFHNVQNAYRKKKTVNRDNEAKSHAR